MANKRKHFETIPTYTGKDYDISLKETQNKLRSLQKSIEDLLQSIKTIDEQATLLARKTNTLANSFAPAAVIEPLLASDHLN